MQVLQSLNPVQRRRVREIQAQLAGGPRSRPAIGTPPLVLPLSWVLQCADGAPQRTAR
jgi:hypothetical protein